MSLITVFSVFAIVPLEVSAAEGIEYIYRWWDSGAQGGSLNRFAMYGGTLTAVHGGSGAGIGGGKRAKDKGGYGGNITISSGSKVVATSSDYGEAQDLVNRLDGYIDHSGMKTDDIA